MQETRDKLARHYRNMVDPEGPYQNSEHKLYAPKAHLKYPNYKKYSEDLYKREEKSEKEEEKEKGFLDKVKEKLGV